MTDANKITLFHIPNSRSSGTRFLLEELDAPYDLHVLNMQAGEQRQPAFLVVNPMGKVPAILHGDALVTEQVAIYVYLADLFAEAGLAPKLNDPNRGPYLRWMVFYAACFEPAVVDKAMKREPGPAAMSPYGDFDTVLSAVTARLEAGPYILGQDFLGGRCAMGHGLAVDHHVWPGYRDSGDQGLYRAGLLSSGGRTGKRTGRRTGGITKIVLKLERWR